MGKTKDVLRLARSEFFGFRFKDNILGRSGVPDSGGNEVVGQAPGKGVLACTVACRIFEELRRAEIPNHFVERIGDDSIMVRRTDPIRIEFISRNDAYGAYLRAHPEVRPLTPIVGTRELTLKDDEKDDPQMAEAEALARGLLTEVELASALVLLVRVTEVLTDFYESRHLRLCDLKMEVGRADPGGRLIVIDDLGYDNSRVFSGGRLLGIEELHAALID